MLTQFYIEPLLIDGDLADKVWPLWADGEIDDQVAAIAWWLLVQ